MIPSPLKHYLLQFVATIAVMAFASYTVAGSPGDESGGMQARGMQASNMQNSGSDGDGCNTSVKSGGCIVVLMDHMKHVKVKEPVSVVVIGNPAIADVNLIDSQLAFISAKSIGTTNMIALNASGDEIANYQIVVTEPLLKRVSIRRALAVENYQCAPYCNRALSITDTAQEYSITAGAVVLPRIEMNERETVSSTETNAIQGLNLAPQEE